ncbi:MAG: caspase family protein [Xanthobacteraceae bacterium]
MYRLLINVAALASTCWIGMSHALAEHRMALVIGNSNYATVMALPNPASDARAMAKFLNSAGFQVLQAPDLSQTEMRRTIGDFASMVADKGPDTVALVFYAGHGLQVDGENYLVPVDAKIQREADVPLQAMRLADLMNALASVPSKTRIVILDACRNNPFSEINKTTGRGLAIVDAPTGSLVSYSTAPGTEAQDGDGTNSPYTSALLNIGQKSDLPIEQMLKLVRLAVNDATNRQQIPWESSSLTSDFAFFPSGAQVLMPNAGQPTTPATARTETRSVEAWQKELKSRNPREAYEIVIREDKVEAYQAYLELYPSQSMAPVVRTIVERRREMIAWYTAVTINTVASYESFVAAFASSDFAGTATRLITRAAMRSVSNATSAFAAVGPTCPCSLPPAPPAPRTKRADVAPTRADAGASTAPAGGPATKVVTGVAVASKPPVIEVYDDPPPVRVRVRDWPRRKHVDDDKPKRPESRPERPSRQVDKVTKPPKPLRTYPTRTVTPNTTVVPRTTTGMVPRPMINRGPMFSRPMPMGPRFGGGMRMGRFR